MILQITICLFLLCSFPSNNLDTVCIFLILAGTISSIFEFIFTYVLYLIDSKKALYNSIEPTQNYLYKIIRIAFPVAITSYIRSGLSTVKEILIPFSLEKYSASCDEALSQYGFINGMVMPILMFPCIVITSCASLLIPEFARYNLKRDFAKMRKVISFIFKIASFFSIGVIGLFLAYPKEISILFYKNSQIASFLILLAPLVILIYLDKIIDAMLRGLDKQVGVMFCNIFDLVSTIFLIYTIVPVFGIYGYIAIIAFSEVLNFSISLLQLYKVTHFKFNVVSWVLKPVFIAFFCKILVDFLHIDFVVLKLGMFILLYAIFISISSKEAC